MDHVTLSIVNAVIDRFVEVSFWPSIFLGFKDHYTDQFTFLHSRRKQEEEDNNYVNHRGCLCWMTQENLQMISKILTNRYL